MNEKRIKNLEDTIRALRAEVLELKAKLKEKEEGTDETALGKRTKRRSKRTSDTEA